MHTPQKTRGAKNGTKFDMTGLDVSRPANGFISVTMYSEKDKNKPVNERATTLARACGRSAKLVYGNALVARAAFDYTNSRW